MASSTQRTAERMRARFGFLIALSRNDVGSSVWKNQRTLPMVSASYHRHEEDPGLQTTMVGVLDIFSNL
ncbi:MAG TPA: hypothetical protein V6D15_17255 [Oculatellaceae cyanobacterium]